MRVDNLWSGHKQLHPVVHVMPLWQAQGPVAPPQLRQPRGRPAAPSDIGGRAEHSASGRTRAVFVAWLALDNRGERRSGAASTQSAWPNETSTSDFTWSAWFKDLLTTSTISCCEFATPTATLMRRLSAAVGPTCEMAAIAASYGDRRGWAVIRGGSTRVRQ